MLEIFLIIWLSNKNARTVKEKGRKPALFVVLTVLLWVGGEFLGAILAILFGFESSSIYIMALLFAVVGAVSSHLIAKGAKPGTEVFLPEGGPLVGARYLAQPAEVRLVRDGSFVGSLASYRFTLNGQPVGALQNKASLTTATSLE